MTRVRLSAGRLDAALPDPMKLDHPIGPTWVATADPTDTTNATSAIAGEILCTYLTDTPWPLVLTAALPPRKILGLQIPVQRGS
jgi:hypothetical protein